MVLKPNDLKITKKQTTEHFGSSDSTIKCIEKIK